MFRSSNGRYLLLTDLFTFVSLEAACKTIPEIPNALTGQTSPHREKFIVFSQANGL